MRVGERDIEKEEGKGGRGEGRIDRREEREERRGEGGVKIIKEEEGIETAQRIMNGEKRRKLNDPTTETRPSTHLARAQCHELCCPNHNHHHHLGTL